MPTTTPDQAIEHALNLVGEMAERRIARLICREVLIAVQSLPVGQREYQANTLLHQALLREMLAFKDRLAKQCEAVLTEGVAMVTAGESK